MELESDLGFCTAVHNCKRDNSQLFSSQFINPQFLKTSNLFCFLPAPPQVTVNGKTIQAVQGQRLRDVVLAAKAKVEYGCEKVNERLFIY